MSGRAGTALLSVAIEPKTMADRERLVHGLGTLMWEDQTIEVTTDRTTGEVVVAGRGEQHLEVIVDRLKREFNVEASLGRPRVAYKETVTRPADGEGRYAGQADGRGQYAHVKIHLYPGERGSGYVFENEIAGGAIPQEFIKPIDDGITEALARGLLAGYRVDDVRVVLYDGSYHDVDSSAMAFQHAGSMAFLDAAGKAKPRLLEPIMHIEVVAPKEHMGEVIGDLSSRRGRVQSRQDRDGLDIMTARVPLAELFGYATNLRARTRGRGTCTMQLAEYQPCGPPENGGDTADAVVGAPRRPLPTRLRSSVALPEPIDDDTPE